MEQENKPLERWGAAFRQLIPSGQRERFDREAAAAARLTPEEALTRQAALANQIIGHPDEKRIKAGLTDDYFDAVDCPLCKNKYFTYAVRDGNLTACECTCTDKRRALIQAKCSGLEELTTLRINGFQAAEPWQKELKSAAIAFLEREEPAGWFVALGQSGAGKTHICSAICNKLLADGKRVRYLSWVQFSRKIERVRFDDEQRDRIFNEFADSPVLYIDDFLKGYLDRNAAEHALAIELIGLRYDSPKKITLLSSEFSISDLAAIDEAVAGRIRQRAGRFLVQIRPDSKRNYRLYGGQT